MDKTFYEQYRDGVNASILKMYEFKKKYFEQGGKKRFVAQPKVSYIFREDEGQAFIGLCNALTNYLNWRVENGKH